MAIALNPCVQSILCGLSTATLNALKGFITTQKTFIDAQIIALEAQVAKYNILAGVVGAAENLVVGELAQIRSVATLLPLQLIAGCTDLGNLNLAIQQNIDAVTSSLQVFSEDLIRILSFVDELNVAIAAYQQISNLYLAILNTINLCGGNAGM